MSLLALNFSYRANHQTHSGRPAYDKIVGYFKKAKDAGAEILIGGTGGSYSMTLRKSRLKVCIYQGDDSKGYFIQPTVILSKDPQIVTFVEEIFGPVLSVWIYIVLIYGNLHLPLQVYVFDDKDYEKTLELVDSTTQYGLTGSM